MESNISLRGPIILILIVGTVYSLIVGILFYDRDLFKTNEIAHQEKSFGIPVRIIIPKIQVDAELEHVGLTPYGQLEVPVNITRAAWYDLGPRPGEVGSAVIDGHFGWKDKIPAVFDNLHKLEIGDEVHILDENGDTAIFVVQDIRTYKEDDISSEVFVSSDGKAHLNLITCEGIWSKTKYSYSNRLVVFADLI